jgi:hypothetical protein
MTTDAREELYAIRADLDAVEAEVARMPAWKRLTPFGRDRLAERHRLRLRCETLRRRHRLGIEAG